MFRYTPSPVDDSPKSAADDAEEVADWFNTQTDPEIAQAVARAEAEARKSVPPLGSAPSESLEAPTQSHARWAVLRCLRRGLPAATAPRNTGTPVRDTPPGCVLDA